MKNKRNRKKRLSWILIFPLVISMLLTGCGENDANVRIDDDTVVLSYKDSLEEMNAMLDSIEKNVTIVSNPAMDIYAGESSEASALDDISTFPITVEGKGDINIEIAAATEISGDEAPDDWMNVVAKNFNKGNYELNGKSVTVSVRQITSGEVVTYVQAGAYEPDVYIPSAEAWGNMLKASGCNIEKLTDRIAGNTAGILMTKDSYNSITEKYEEVTISTVLKAAIEGDILFATTNPYTSTTGLNVLTAELSAMDPENPLSDKAQSELLEYQAIAPRPAYTTAVLRNSAAKGLINAMAMEEQAYVSKPELAGYEYIPFGFRHDHPVYVFDWTSDEKVQAAQMFIDYCLSEKSQELAVNKGFNKHDDYVSQDPGLDGAGYLTAQKVWKDTRYGGKPILAVFIADVSTSMRGEPLAALQKSLLNGMSYIGSQHYVGLISYSDSITVNLPIAQFDNKQKAYFSGETENLMASGNTATYDAVLYGLKMLDDKQNELKAEGIDTEPVLFLLSDGEPTAGYTLERIKPVVKGLKTPIYTIAYNYTGATEMTELAQINEANDLSATSDDISNQIRQLFNTQL